MLLVTKYQKKVGVTNCEAWHAELTAPQPINLNEFGPFGSLPTSIKLINVEN